MFDLVRLLERPLVVAHAFERLDAIVVLGAPLRRDGAPTAVLAERIAAAADLFHRGGAPTVIASGGITQRDSRAEADAIADALVAAGVPRAAIIVERASLTTADNARYAAALLSPGARVWLVTQPFHGRRAARLFRREGLAPSVWHITDSPRRMRWIVREYAAWLRLLAPMPRR